MTKNAKQSTINALNKYCTKYFGEERPKPRDKKNKKPEKIVEKACLEYMRAVGWSVQIFEAKATWSPQQNCYVSQGMKAGTCDCMGSTDEGIAVAVEFKAPGRLSTFNREDNYLQKNFILEKINSNAFACVVDSADHLREIVVKWKLFRKDGLEAARNYLLSALPKSSQKTRLKDEKLFDDDSGNS